MRCHLVDFSTRIPGARVKDVSFYSGEDDRWESSSSQSPHLANYAAMTILDGPLATTNLTSPRDGNIGQKMGPSQIRLCFVKPKSIRISVQVEIERGAVGANGELAESEDTSRNGIVHRLTPVSLKVIEP